MTLKKRESFRGFRRWLASARDSRYPSIFQEISTPVESRKDLHTPYKTLKNRGLFELGIILLILQQNGRENSNPRSRSHRLHVNPTVTTFLLVRWLIAIRGGSIINELLKAKDQPYIISALVRKPEQVDKLKEIGVHGMLFKSLDDFEVIKDAAKNHDSESRCRHSLDSSDRLSCHCSCVCSPCRSGRSLSRRPN